MKEFIETLAKICHEANKAYCESMGDTSQQPWDKAPDWQKESARNGVRFHLASHREPFESHESWMREKKASGWTHGPVKDETKKTHPCMVPYKDLPLEQRMKDFLFGGIVNSFKKAMN